MADTNVKTGKDFETELLALVNAMRRNDGDNRANVDALEKLLNGRKVVLHYYDDLSDHYLALNSATIIKLRSFFLNRDPTIVNQVSEYLGDVFASNTYNLKIARY